MDRDAIIGNEKHLQVPTASSMVVVWCLNGQTRVTVRGVQAITTHRADKKHVWLYFLKSNPRSQITVVKVISR